MEAEHTTYSDITHLEKTLSVQVQTIMPQEIVDIIDAAINEESSDPQYEEYLITLNQLLKELVAAIEDPDNYATQRTSKSLSLSVDDFKADFDNMIDILKTMFGDIASDERMLFLESGMGYGKSVSLDVELSGSTGAGIVAVLSGFGGGGVELVYDFLHFQRALFPFTLCGLDVGLGLDAEVSASGSIGASGMEDWIFGFEYDINDFSGTAVGGQVGLDADQKLAAGLDLGLAEK